ncbi:MAG: LURP-one-related family protein [Candidatus Freyarchaeum deiterrae]
MGLLDYKSYIIDRKMSLILDNFSIMNDSNEEIGAVESKLISLNGEFKILDKAGKVVGKIKGKLSLRPAFNIYDEKNSLIAIAKRKIVDSGGSEYWVENQEGQKILEATPDFSGQEYQIKNPEGELIADISEKISNLNDAYIINIHNHIDPLIILALTISIDCYENKKNQLELITGFED